MTARMRRLYSDWEQVKKDFAGHKYIVVTPVGAEPPEKYHVTYYVNGIYVQPDGQIGILCRHEVEITLHAEYPRYKPICRILTPIWHPNFRDGQICIGDIWGAGESLSDIIIHIGDMIQYKSWNSASPLCADAAKWAIENKHLFPVGTAELHVADYASASASVEIDLFDDAAEAAEPPEKTELLENHMALDVPAAPVAEAPNDGNDFEITAEELAGIAFVPTAQRMQTLRDGVGQRSRRVNFKTILVKGILWGLLGALLGFILSDLIGGVFDESDILNAMGYPYLCEWMEASDRADEAFENGYQEFVSYAKKNNIDSDDTDAFISWYSYEANDKALQYFDEYDEYDEKADEAFDSAYYYEFDEDGDAISDVIANAVRLDSAIWSAIIALMIGIFLGIGEGVFYGSAQKALLYAAVGALCSIVLGFISGYLAQWMYATMLKDDSSELALALLRGLGWAVMGLGVGLSVGLIKPAGKRILFCVLGGIVGAFLGGFLFNFFCDLIPNDIVSRGVGIVLMGLLIGLGVGLLEQFAKQAWLKVIRGEFEGKEYLVFAGTTSIGNNGKNTIVLFKDKLVGPHHCDIKLQGSSYVLYDCGTPMGTIVNGSRIARHVLRRGDTIAIGNSVLVFQTK